MNKQTTQQGSQGEQGTEEMVSSKRSKPSRLAVSGMVLAGVLGVQVALSAWIYLDAKIAPERWPLIASEALEAADTTSSSDQASLPFFGGQAQASQNTSKNTDTASKGTKEATSVSVTTATASSRGTSQAQQPTKATTQEDVKETYAYSAPVDIRSWAASKDGASLEEIKAALTPTPEEIAESVDNSLKAEKDALQSLPGEKVLITFDALSQTNQTLEGPAAESVQAAIAGFQDIGCDVGFVLYDISSQQGISYNVDQSFFAASTIKAPFASYAMEAVGRGEASLDEEIVETRSMEGTGIMAYDDRSTYSLEEVFANTLMHSDNTGYLLLQDRFSREAFGNWAAATGSGLDANLFLGADGFPSASARMMALLWNKIAANAWTTPESTDDNTTLSAAFNPDETPILDWLNNADESFIRAALGDSAAVYSKTGYETPDYGASALNDCGLVVDEYGPYILIMLTSAPFDDTYFRDNEAYAITLIQALAQARETEIIEQP